MLDATLKTQLKAYLEKVQQPFEIVASLDDSDKSREMSELLHEIVGLTDKITLREDGSDARKPSFALNRPGANIGLAFAGIPMGHEFTSLVLALLQVGGHPSKLEADVIEQIKGIQGSFEFETYFSLSCQNCPDVVQALNLMAVLNPNIRHVAIDGALFQEEVERRQVMAVPSIYLNGEVFGQGRMGVEEILAKIDTGAAAREAEKLSAKEEFDVLVVGGGPAGAAAAIYAARKGIRTGVAAERFGGQVLDTMAIENFISVTETEGPKLARQLEEHVKHYDVDIMNLQRASALIPAKTAGGLHEVQFEGGGSLKAKSVILATGARWREMGVPGEKEYKAKGVCFCPHCDGPLFKGKRVAVIGGGNSGVEAAIDLAGIVSHVTLLEFDSKLRADAVLQRKLFSLPNVDVITSALTSEVKGDGQKVTGLVYKDRNSEEFKSIDLEGIFVQIGLLPNSEWLKGTIELTSRGEIIVDARGETSLPGIFAAGDVTTVPYKQIVIAVGEGAKASLSAFDHLIRTSAPA
ncbi:MULTISPECIES: alkyl hydroperoxide reductase subunit F [Pseudomonas]|uniref:Alkyl hydroperoxide reductase subunit F n=1 Tax=Pseudomonas nitroreducens TaxID=46680 RepID=A0A246FD78_PSENT|nr:MULTISPECIES: alkyl hydroperoxide reductase subunit F [Pseudomonas]MCG8908492.1 alkyl hydroperoxide reductase subunit F [Pseudomonas sp. DP-17]MDU4250229.1 alkyl hydroperoxide reductase subunit F [Pseudomonas sp.]OWP52256.1 alkyl hydroperoxide reductase subunit F [Pseudomonas nitroreducens]